MAKLKLSDITIEQEDTTKLNSHYTALETINAQLARIVAHCPGVKIKETITIDARESMTLIFSNALDQEVEERR